MKEPVSSLRKTDSLLLIYFGSNRTEWKIIWISGDDQLTWIDDIPLVNTHISS
jgi:hypothetical protein